MRELVPLFAFELAPVEEIEPWGTPEDPKLSWFALSFGTFSVNVGDQQLFVYSPEVEAIWGLGSRLVDYQVAGLARDMLEPVCAAVWTFMAL